MKELIRFPIPLTEEISPAKIRSERAGRLSVPSRVERLAYFDLSGLFKGNLHFGRQDVFLLVLGRLIGPDGPK